MQMDSESKVPNTELRRQRELRGWSQKRLADAIDTSKEMVSKWECGQNPGKYYQEKLCNLFGKTAQELGFICEPNRPAPLSHDNVDQMLPANNGLQGTDWLIVRKLTRLQTWMVDCLEDGTRLRWQCYYTSSNSLTEDGLQNFAHPHLAKSPLLMNCRRLSEARKRRDACVIRV
jgi:transcriptional regulator with XRE-family HTH domain